MNSSFTTIDIYSKKAWHLKDVPCFFKFWDNPSNVQGLPRLCSQGSLLVGLRGPYRVQGKMSYPLQYHNGLDVPLILNEKYEYISAN